MENMVALIALCLSGVGVVCGGAWWMSALYSRVKSIQERVDEFVADHKSAQARLWNKVEEIDSRLDTMDVRMTTIETRLE
tara:strand:+ start:418 stop:657 length:240 start_codon:yes stop_codon:yes gene_type:complete